MARLARLWPQSCRIRSIFARSAPLSIEGWQEQAPGAIPTCQPVSLDDGGVVFRIPRIPLLHTVEKPIPRVMS
ncbi:hypothetical protein BEI_0801 [Halomonas beimenensis]|uniref:Uncharacterized protein n=1 Tax=Halomonas beimenensis TaxID=475662 RepID=A0A291P4J1_9GAMM|nr:hypothetical protein BEI_0801 [Halomonas beimenensis]